MDDILSPKNYSFLSISPVAISRKRSDECLYAEMNWESDISWVVPVPSPEQGMPGLSTHQKGGYITQNDRGGSLLCYLAIWKLCVKKRDLKHFAQPPSTLIAVVVLVAHIYLAGTRSQTKVLERGPVSAGHEKKLLC